MEFLVAGIDGTGSREWRARDGSNSHIFQFVRDLRHTNGRAHYWHGPDSAIPHVAGVEIQRIVPAVIRWIVQTMMPMSPRCPDGVDPARMMTSCVPLSESDYRQVAELLRQQMVENIKICIVGHSRGGLVAVMVAERLRLLRLPVYFMGLYDAVDRASCSIGCDASTITNTQHVYHARRDPRMESRGSFGNDAVMPAGTSWYHEQFFMTSHGGIGGSPEFHPDDFSDDYSCSVDGLSADIQRAMGADPYETCLEGSRAADRWIRDNGRAHGLSFR